MSLGAPTKSAVMQAARYAFDESADFALVSNGWQFIAFAVPNNKWKNGRALVFSSLDEVADKFKLFWDNLSPEAMACAAISETLSKASFYAAPPAKRNHSIPSYSTFKNRNSFQTDLQILGDLVFGDSLFADRAIFHRHCYCNSGALPQHTTATKSYLEDRYPELFSSTVGTPTLEQATTKRGTSTSLTNFTNFKKPILIIGEIGVGKTTFLEHLFLVEFEHEKNKLVTIRIDLGDKPSEASDLPKTAFDAVQDTLNSDYCINISSDTLLRRVYKKELIRFKNSPDGALSEINPTEYTLREVAFIRSLVENRDRHINSIFDYLEKNNNKHVVVIFDNVDQRNIHIQNMAYMQAQVSASTWNAFTIITLRPDTYVKLKYQNTDETGQSISGYHPRAFTISPPRFDHLIQKRIETSIKILNGSLAVPTYGDSIKLHAKSVASYLEVLLNSFTNKPDLVTFCQDMSGGNMRLALDYLVAFMSSGHVDAEKILTRHSEQDHGYEIPVHEFIRGVLFGEYEHYHSDSSLVCNVFDCATGDKFETFLQLAILSKLHKEVIQSNGSTSHFVEKDCLSRELFDVGFAHHQIEPSISKMLRGRLLETNTKTTSSVPYTHLRISQTGTYYYLVLARTFAYIDPVSMDTPIFDKSTHDALQDVRPIRDRIERCRVFIKYLDSMIKQNRALYDYCSWKAFYDDIVSDVNRAEERNVKNILRNNGKY